VEDSSCQPLHERILKFGASGTSNNGNLFFVVR